MTGSHGPRPESSDRWTWDDAAHPRVFLIFDEAPAAPEWCDRLETAPGDAIVGKVLCVRATAAIAREALAATGAIGQDAELAEALDLLDRWIDDPIDERFERICDRIFGDSPWPESDPGGVVWCTLRTATSSIGNFEAGWALGAACKAARRAGFCDEDLRRFARRGLISRARRRSGGRGPTAVPGR